MVGNSKERLDIASVLGDVLRGDLDDANAYREIYRADARRRDLAKEKNNAEFQNGDDECPICSISHVEFLPFGLADRKNSRCPNCDSLERHRLLWLFLRQRYTGKRNLPRLLHIAPEPCLRMPMRRLWGNELISLDLADPTTDIQGDICSLPIANASFDLVVCSHVLEHIPDDQTAMNEIARVLKPGARAIIMVPLAPEKATEEDWSLTTPQARLERFGHPFHYRIYGGDIVGRLTKAGFNTEILATNDIANSAHKKRYRLNRNHILNCRMPV